MGHSICVFCGSIEVVQKPYFRAAEELGEAIGSRGWNLVFGGGMTGLMGSVARSVHQHGGTVTAIIPSRLHREGITYKSADELIVTETMNERKSEMDRRSESFVALPGGFGTADEIFEFITLKQLGYHSRPLVLINTLGFYDSLLAFIDHQVQEKFIKPEGLALHYVSSSVSEAMRYIENYKDQALPDKFS